MCVVSCTCNYYIHVIIISDSVDPSPSTEKEGLVTTVCAWVDSIVNLLVELFVYYLLYFFCTMVTHVVDNYYQEREIAITTPGSYEDH